MSFPEFPKSKNAFDAELLALEQLLGRLGEQARDPDLRKRPEITLPSFDVFNPGTVLGPVLDLRVPVGNPHQSSEISSAGGETLTVAELLAARRIGYPVDAHGDPISDDPAKLFIHDGSVYMRSGNRVAQLERGTSMALRLPLPVWQSLREISEQVRILEVQRNWMPYLIPADTESRRCRSMADFLLYFKKLTKDMKHAQGTGCTDVDITPGFIATENYIVVRVLHVPLADTNKLFRQAEQFRSVEVPQIVRKGEDGVRFDMNGTSLVEAGTLFTHIIDTALPPDIPMRKIMMRSYAKYRKRYGHFELGFRYPGYYRGKFADLFFRGFIRSLTA